MELREWALIIFTTLTQLSVGSFVVLGIVHFFAARKYGANEADRLSDRALLAIGPAMALGLIASLLHLGNPMSAYRAVTNFDSSWLSREILLTVTFFVIGGVFAIMQWRKIGSPMVRNIIAWIAAIVGLFAIYSMSRIYMVPVQPAWNTSFTPLTFFVAAFLLGTLAIGAAYVANYAYINKKAPEDCEVQLEILRTALRWISLAAVVLLGIELVITPLYLAYLAGGNPAAAETASMMGGEFGAVLVLRLVLAFLGAGVLALFLYQNAASSNKEKILAVLAYSAFLLVLVSEVLGRYLFYATHVGVGV